jgi:parvulin-like peptidyl-prolyl isomerase
MQKFREKGKYKMKGILTLGIVLAVPVFCAGAEMVDGIVATVGSEPILQSELMQEIAPILNELRDMSKSEEEFNQKAMGQLREALDQAIEYKILLREALLAGHSITDEQVEQRITEIKKRFGSNEEFMAELEKAGETMGDFRGRIKKQILALSMGMLKRKEFERAAEVTESDVSKYYEDNKDKLSHPERVQVRRIFLAATAEATERAAVKAKIQDLKSRLNNGVDFADLAKTFSSGPEAEKGGMVGWVARGDLVKNLEDAAYSLPEGGISDVLETEFGFSILKVEKKEQAGTPTLQEARKQIEPELRAKKADEAYNKWMSELRKRSRVRIFI